MVNSTQRLYPSECEVVKSSLEAESVPRLPADPYKCEAFNMEEMKNMRIEENLTGNSASMRGEFRGQNCFMKMVNISQEVYLDQMRNEIAVYKHLERLQKKHIPNFFGYVYLAGFLEVLVLEECGKHAERATEYDLVSFSEIIHAYGVLHGNAAHRNIVRRACREYVLIDFGLSKIGNIS